MTKKVGSMLEIINLVCTIISIIATVVSVIYSQQAKKYKEDTLQLMDILHLSKLFGEFIAESDVFLERTGKSQWNKGVDPNSIISRFQRVLSSLPEVYHLVNTPGLLDARVNDLNQIVNTYDTANKEQKIQAKNLIFDIRRILIQAINQNRNNI